MLSRSSRLFQRAPLTRRPSRPFSSPPSEGGPSMLTYMALPAVGYSAYVVSLCMYQGVSTAEKYDPVGLLGALRAVGLLGGSPRALQLAKPQAPITQRVYMDVEIGGEDAGRIVVGLYGGAGDAEKTAANFAGLCEGTKGRNGARLAYEGSPFHRIIPGFMVQGGDITRGNGTGGSSIWGGSFADERGALALKHDGAGVLSMANRGPNTQSSQFFITTAPAKWLDGKHGVFGVVVEGVETLEKLEAIGSRSGRTSKNARVKAAGKL